MNANDTNHWIVIIYLDLYILSTRQNNGVHLNSYEYSWSYSCSFINSFFHLWFIVSILYDNKNDDDDDD